MERPPDPEAELSSPQRRAFALAEKAARSVVRRRFRLVRLTKSAYTKLERHESALARVARDLRSLVRLAMAWAKQDYRRLPWKSVVYVVAALIYFVNPVDLIPDVLTGIGFVADAAVVAAVVRSIADDLAAFRQWERQRTSGAGDDPAFRELYPSSAAA